MKRASPLSVPVLCAIRTAILLGCLGCLSLPSFSQDGRKKTSAAKPKTTVTVVKGDGQSAEISKNYPDPLQIKVTDASGKPVSGASVEFSAKRGKSGVRFLSEAKITTNSDGMAEVRVQANTNPGRVVVNAKVSGASQLAVFTLRNGPARPPSDGSEKQITGQIQTPENETVANPNAQNGQNAQNGTPRTSVPNRSAPAPAPAGTQKAPVVSMIASGICGPVTLAPMQKVHLAVLVTAYGVPLSGAKVTVTPPSDASMPGLTITSPTDVTTDAQGIAGLDASPNGHTGRYAVSFSTPGLQQPVAFDITNVAATASGTSFISKVAGDCQSTITSTAFATPLTVTLNPPVSGVPITFSAPVLVPPDPAQVRNNPSLALLIGPSATFATAPGVVIDSQGNALVSTDATGTAKVTAIANPGVGAYTIAVSVQSFNVQQAQFTLANTAPAAVSQWDTTCDSIMGKVIANESPQDTDLELLLPCTRKILDLSVVLSSSNVTIARSQLTGGNANDTTLVFQADVAAPALDPLYFGWRKADVFRDALIRINSYVLQLADWAASNRRFGFISVPFGHQGRLKGQYDDLRQRAKEKMLNPAGAEPLSSVRALSAVVAPATMAKYESDALQSKTNANAAQQLKQDEQQIDKEIDSQLRRIETNLSDAAAILNTLMENNGLTEPFSGLLETYLIPYSNAGSNAVPSALQGLNQSNQTFAAGFLSFESNHFRTRKVQAGEISVGGRVGVTPVQTLVSLSNDPNLTATPAKPPVPKSYLQNAFEWSLNTRWSTHLGKRTLVAALASFGDNVLISGSQVVNPSTVTTMNPPAQQQAAAAASPAPATTVATNATTTTPFGNHTQNGAWFGELGPELRIYPHRLRRVDDEKTYLSPSFSFSTGMRLDERFAGLGQTTYNNFRRPTQRFFLRAFVTLNNIGELNPNSAKKPNESPLFTVALGFEYDSAWGSFATTACDSYSQCSPGRLLVPADSKVYINASIDLVKAFSKQQQ